MPPRFPLLAALAVLVSVMLSGCGPGVVKSNVLRFHTLPATPTSMSFAVMPRQDQEGSLEFRAYRDLIAQRLLQLGLRQAPASAKPDLVVTLHYSVDDGRVEVWSTPIYSYNDFWSRYYGAAAAWPYPYYDATGANVNSATVFTHRLEVQMVDGASFRAGKPENVFEGRAVAERRTRELVSTMPFLVESLFQGFPGASGVPVIVRIPTG